MLHTNFGHFPSYQTIKKKCRSLPPYAQFDEKLSVLCAGFSWRFGNFDVHKLRFELFSNPFTFDVEKAPTNLQKKLIELQFDETLKSKFDAVEVAQFPQFIPDTMSQPRTKVAQLLSMFGSTYNEDDENVSQETSD